MVVAPANDVFSPVAVDFEHTRAGTYKEGISNTSENQTTAGTHSHVFMRVIGKSWAVCHVVRLLAALLTSQHRVVD